MKFIYIYGKDNLGILGYAISNGLVILDGKDYT